MTVPPRGWLVQAVNPVVRQPFYAALDAAGALCWTNEPGRAERFLLREAAERFALIRLPDDEWTVTR